MDRRFYGSLSLTKLGDIARKHPEAVKEVEFKDGHKEKMIDCDIFLNENPDEFGRIATLKAKNKKDKPRIDKSLAYVANFKEAEQREQASTNQHQQQQQPQHTADWENGGFGDLPF